MRRILVSLLALTVFGSMAAVSTAASSKPTRGGLQTGNVSLKVLAPTPFQVVTGPELALHVNAGGYKLNDYFAGSPVLSEIGHYHELLDNKLVDMTPLQGPNHDAISMVGVTPGLHVLTIVPALDSHMTLMNREVNVPFFYEGPYIPESAGYTGTGTPSIAITSPTPGSIVHGKSFTMTVDVQNFVLCGGCFAKELVPGAGHWHVFEDKMEMSHMRQMASTNTVTVPTAGYKPGRHTFYAVLTDNHHMPIMPMAMASVTLLVK